MTPQASLYRRHRPQSFDQVVGQEHVVRTLSNAVERDRVHHAYLFVGSRGTGKTSLAKILARSLNCVNGPTLTPCGECESCRSIAAGTSLDVIEMDAASNRSVDDIRDLRDRVSYAPTAGGWKVYILDEAHMLTREAWNAFLKTLEEPPPNTVFVLATTEPHKVMATIVDRCQRFDFQRPSLEQIAEVIRRVGGAEGIEIEDGAVAAIARAAAGSFRDALGTLDQLVSYGGPQVRTEDVLAVLGVADAELILAAADAIAAADGRGALEASERLSRSGRDVTQFARDLLAHLRQLLVIRTIGELPDAFSVTAAEPERLRAQADAVSDLALSRAIDSLSAALAAVREGDEPRMTVELALLRAARPQLDPSREALAQRLERIEAALEGAAPAGGSSEGAGSSGLTAAPAKSQTSPGGDARNLREAPAPPPDPAPSAPADSAPEAADGNEVEAADRAEHRGPVATAEAPAPVAQAVAAVESAVQSVDLDRLIELWPSVIEQVRDSGSEFLSTVFSVARPVAVDVEQAVLEVGFPSSAAFNKRKAEAAEARDQFTAAVKAIVGERLKPVYVMLDGDEEQAGPEASPLSDDEALALAAREFNAELVDDEPGPNETEAKEA